MGKDSNKKRNTSESSSYNTHQVQRYEKHHKNKHHLDREVSFQNTIPHDKKNSSRESTRTETEISFTDQQAGYHQSNHDHKGSKIMNKEDQYLVGSFEHGKQNYKDHSS